MFCKQCGSQTDDDDKFCEQCGSPAQDEDYGGQPKSYFSAPPAKSKKGLWIGIGSALAVLIVAAAVMFMTGVFGGAVNTANTINDPFTKFENGLRGLGYVEFEVDRDYSDILKEMRDDGVDGVINIVNYETSYYYLSVYLMEFDPSSEYLKQTKETGELIQPGETRGIRVIVNKNLVLVPDIVPISLEVENVFKSLK